MSDLLSTNQWLAKLFVARCLKRSSKGIALEWLKVQAEIALAHAMGRTGQRWLPQAVLLEALQAARYRTRIESDGKVTVCCSFVQHKTKAGGT